MHMAPNSSVQSFCLLLVELHEVPVDSVLKLIQVCLDKPLDRSSHSSREPFPLTLCRVKSLFCVTVEVTDDDAEHSGTSAGAHSVLGTLSSAAARWASGH